MDNENKKSYKLSIYLLKDEIKSFKAALKESVYILNEYDFSQEIEIEGKIILGATKSSQPAWKELIQEAVAEALPDLKNTSNRAIVFFNIDGRIFALPFGYGKHLLKEEAIDRDFGLRTVLNIVNADKLVSIDKANLNDLTVLTRTQASRKSRPETFNIDVIKDLLKSVTGEPSNSTHINFGKIITGNESINIIPTIDFADIPNHLRELKKAFESDKYKERFDWIDNIKSERDPIVLEALRASLAKDLENKNDEKIHLAPPFLIEWESFEGF
ncbi:TIGR04141 family sporadically distributed protein, partial [Bacteroidota bacterium]